MSKCDQEHCPGHLGKFQDCLAEALYELSLDGTYDDTGDVEWGSHYILMLFEADDTVAIDQSNRIVTVPAGNYILEGTNSGAVYLNKYDTDEGALEAFNQSVQAYSNYQEDEES